MKGEDFDRIYDLYTHGALDLRFVIEALGLDPEEALRVAEKSGFPTTGWVPDHWVDGDGSISVKFHPDPEHYGSPEFNQMMRDMYSKLGESHE